MRVHIFKISKLSQIVLVISLDLSEWERYENSYAVECYSITILLFFIEGIPNIIGFFNQYVSSILRNGSVASYDISGMFTGLDENPTYRASALDGSLTSYVKGIYANAHNSNAVYTDSDKVYPLSLTLNFIIKC